MNPYQQEFIDLMKIEDNKYLYTTFVKRQELVKKYSWAIPSDYSLDLITELSPIIEIGSGKAYWAQQLSIRGADIICYDIFLNGENYIPVMQGSAELTKLHPNRTLFLCWPPYNTPMAAIALNNYTGDKLVYVGEGDGGCTGDDTFHKRLDNSWNMEKIISIPQWPGVHDVVHFYRRK